MRHPSELHGCAHGRQRTAHEPDCASNTCLQKKGKKCSPSSSCCCCTYCNKEISTGRFRENGGNESPRRSTLFLSVFSVRGDAGEQTGAASSWMRRNAQILAATAAAAAAAARSIQPTKAERREWGGGRESRASNY